MYNYTCCSLIPEENLIPENLIQTQKHLLPLSRKRVSYLQWAIVAFLKVILDLSRSMIKPKKWPVRPAKTPVSLGIRLVWTGSSLCALWVAKDPVLLQADREGWSDSVNGQAYQSSLGVQVILLVYLFVWRYLWKQYHCLQMINKTTIKKKMKYIIH